MDWITQTVKNTWNQSCQTDHSTQYLLHS